MTHERALEKLVEANERVAKLEAALKPFATAASAFPDAVDDEEFTSWHPSGLTFGHLKAAEKAINHMRLP
jgi:hypothetical protein